MIIKGPISGIPYTVRELGKCEKCGYIGKVMYCPKCKKWECLHDFSGGVIPNE